MTATNTLRAGLDESHSLISTPLGRRFGGYVVRCTLLTDNDSNGKPANFLVMQGMIDWWTDCKVQRHGVRNKYPVPRTLIGEAHAQRQLWTAWS